MFTQGLQGNHPRYVRVNAGCKHFDVHGGPENIPVSRFSFDAKVGYDMIKYYNPPLPILKEVCWWGHMTIIPQRYEILP